ncbi:Ca2+-binding protein, RTX toxin-related [Paracoccus aminovorans]|uniref:Ca2+-binding protein, RTX toxin-related n=1 Tax=Paracoccus aminovorans TaxID=34004 RepID=A0A1I3FGK7_9RHOB|nr:calcium-binding protein [Paracoccus aminovorans]CQR85887.1 hypothetical protein JCM7685_1313 [Paracoccus aminovorans]SFI10359.1 Ca2+-binding protein, RTX toxin-related [Paracoccus aminovorans]
MANAVGRTFTAIGFLLESPEIVEALHTRQGLAGVTTQFAGAIAGVAGGLWGASIGAAAAASMAAALVGLLAGMPITILSAVAVVGISFIAASISEAIVESLVTQLFEGMGDDLKVHTNDVDVYIGGLRGETLMAGSADDFVYGRGGNDNISGGTGSDHLLGGSGNDTITGGSGDDFISGGSGSNNMTGGVGNDSYVVESEGDTVNENVNGGVDKIVANISINLNDARYANVENVTLIGESNISATGSDHDNSLIGYLGNNRLYGNDGDDHLSGSYGNDTLYGGGGNDTLNGGFGLDSMIGGAGNDIYYVDDLGDVVIEGSNGGEDTINSAISINLDRPNDAYANVEHVVLQGTENINAYGSVSDNSLTGNRGNNLLNGRAGNDSIVGAAGNDTLYGEAGNDILNGGAGVDSMVGGTGNDIYFVDDIRDIIVETATGGTDRINSSISIDLNRSGDVYANIENIILLGAQNLNAYGSGGSNNITGNSGANIISGRYGNDNLAGGAGADTFIFSKNYDQDVITDFEDNTDTIRLLNFGVTTFTQAQGYAADWCKCGI